VAVAQDSLDYRVIQAKPVKVGRESAAECMPTAPLREHIVALEFVGNPSVISLVKRLILFLLLASIAWAASPKTITSSVGITDLNNNAVANGSIVFTISSGANVIGGGQIVQGLTYSVVLDGTGNIPSGKSLWGNDQLQPTGTYYIVNIYNSNGLKVRGPENWIISGASPIDLALETNTALPDPGLGQPVLQNPSSAQTITGQNLTLTGTALLTLQGQLTESVATGTAPFSVTSTTPVANLTVSNHPQVQSCGTTSSCSHTALTGAQVVIGSAPLVSGSPSTVTITGISPAFTSASTYFCHAQEATTAANNLLKVANVSGSSFTITGPNSLTDTINYICVGN
jgi:hypothetical protein